MLSIVEPTQAGLSRRNLLQIGALGWGGLAASDILAANRSQGSRPRAVILLWMTGGPSHIDTYDMKPEAPDIVRGPFASIPTTVPGLDLCELMPRQAPLAHHLTVIRSFTHQWSVHDDAQHLVQTGYPQFNARQAGQQHPCQGSVFARYLHKNDAGIPGYMCVPEDYRRHAGFYQEASFLGSAFNAVNSGAIPEDTRARPSEFALPAELSRDRLQSRRELTESLDGLRRRFDSIPAATRRDDVLRQAYDLILGDRVRLALDLEQETTQTRDDYGRHPWGQYTLLARRLVEAGVPFVTVNLYEKDVDWWDDHYTIEANLRKRLPVYDGALSALVSDLERRGLLNDVLVVACGEFGRAPKIDGGAGRGHWPRAMHAVLAGGGFRHGRIIGSTTRDGGEPADRAMPPGDLLASIYHWMGIDLDLTLTDRLNRPKRLIEEGRPIPELFD